ncbi:fibronectin type III domain-containing protein [Actinoallomurus sp. CA-142502]|uniref:fibronectin type III domain-containing protein n=1 Tax=Actinoallomurus sp. CA-142502 TaxID=3239885 RepID=UPI003D8E8717
MLGSLQNLARRTVRALLARRTPGRTIAGGLAATLLLAGVAFVAGKGIASAGFSTHAGTAWLGTTPRGSVTLVDATSGRPSAEIVLPGTAGHRLQISQDGDTILVYDPSTGVLTKIDSGRLTAGPARATVPGVRLVAGAKAAYLVDYGAGTAQRIDLATLENVGPVIRVPGHLGTAGVDGQGTLWVPRSDDGMAVPVTSNGLGTPVDVQGRGSSMAVSIVGGRPVVVDGTKGRVSVLTATGVAWSAALPGAGSGAALLAPSAQDKGRLPLVDKAGGRLFVVDTDAHKVRAVRLDTGGGHDLGAPAMNGERVYVPDQTTGSVLVYSTSRNTWEPSFPVSGKAGPIDTLPQNDAVYFNDTESSHAVVVGADGTPRPVRKFTPAQPGAKKSPSPAGPVLPGSTPSVPATRPSVPGSGPSGPVTRRTPGPGVPSRPYGKNTSPGIPTTPSDTPTDGTSTPTPPTTPTPTPPTTPTTQPATPAPEPPGAPTGVDAAPQPGGSIRVSWTPPSGAPKNISYTVSYTDGGDSSGSVQTTSTVLTVDATRLVFLRTYTFSVTAHTDGGDSPAATAKARSGGDGKSFTVDVSKTTTDPVNPCTDLPNCRATMRQDPTHDSAATGEAPQGSTVVGYCHKDGQSIGDDDGVRSTQWVLIESGGKRGYVSTLWLGGANAYQSVWPCP